MNGEANTASDAELFLETLAAELTSAAFPIALRHGSGGSWVELELGLWRALAGTVRRWAREWPPAGSSDELDGWRAGLLVVLTERAFSLARKHGIQGPVLEVMSDLYRAFHSVIRHVGQEALWRQLTRVRHS